jgi:hypothetical protein
MSEVNDWMQSNWYELGSLLVQMGFLVAGVWFARKILRTLRASQEQVGALLKLSVFDANAERPAAAAIVERAGRTEEPALTLPDRAEGGARRFPPMVAGADGKRRRHAPRESDAMAAGSGGKLRAAGQAEGAAKSRTIFSSSMEREPILRPRGSMPNERKPRD